jgi:2-dehydro-3-deoxyphosphooctonate aldolase (KDO 8-P synthase)
MKTVAFKNISIGENSPLLIIAGPCLVESEDLVMHTAEQLKKTAKKLPIQLVFKSSYKKANRTSLQGFSGLGMEKALAILEKVKKTFNLPILTDIHTELEAPIAAEVADILQIPAFLCRQTDLLLAAGRTGKVVNIKKGQFLAPEGMYKAAEKVAATGNTQILLTERGTTFGYESLVVDMRSLPIMAKSGYPVIFDATHSVQIPGGQASFSGGQPEFILPLARAAVATGAVKGVFMEVHPNPEKALSDAQSQLPLDNFESVAGELAAFYNFVSEKLR